MVGIVHYHVSIPEGVSDKLGMYGNCALPQIAKQFIGSCVQLFSLQATISGEVVVKSQSSMAFQELTRLFFVLARIPVKSVEKNVHPTKNHPKSGF